jgi:hypothetical protein
VFWVAFESLGVTYLLVKGGMHLPEADSDRIIVGVWWLVVLVIVTSYSGNLVAFLTFPKYEVAITNIEDLLARRGAVSWGILKNTAVEEHLKVSYSVLRWLFLLLMHNLSSYRKSETWYRTQRHNKPRQYERVGTGYSQFHNYSASIKKDNYLHIICVRGQSL